MPPQHAEGKLIVTESGRVVCAVALSTPHIYICHFEQHGEEGDVHVMSQHLESHTGKEISAETKKYNYWFCYNKKL
tara:strand:- start:1846 stop:2073 length:228 start_codon:yes stop_codon:yes gene_type:complete